ncbi:efflux RND transporter periplasmic adaptor subunit [Nitrospirillum sp. BR 11752]|uniref:efflux RND transporter periplasmic adaptor subunit n=1 Tax=Nitrospirillum sp. BR 11752 TaxID=3104293 RepID=UPI002ECB2E1F|nr:efflux RND transporter periplasmic adaptor subunit [Nitrospirillum sp. BR 11752]
MSPPLRRLYPLILALALSGCGDKHPPAAAAAPPAVTVAQPLPRKIVDWDEFTGRFEAVQTVELRARVSGYLEQIKFRDGQLVQKGDLLFVIDPRPFQATLDKANADLQREKTRQALAVSELKRAAQLLAARAISQEEYDTRAQAEQESQAAVASAAAAARSAALDLEFTQIRSPISGRIGDRKIDIGNLVSGGSAQSTLLATIVTRDPIYFVFDGSEADYLRYNRLALEGVRASSRDKANPVFVRLMDETTWTRKGEMDFVDNRLDPSSGTIRGRAVIPNKDDFLQPGTFGRLRLLGSGEYDALLVPDEAIASDQSHKIVMTVGEDGTVTPKPVVLGNLAYGLRVVKSGLAPTDRIIISGLTRARPGAKVTPQPGTITPAAEQ